MTQSDPRSRRRGRLAAAAATAAAALLLGACGGSAKQSTPAPQTGASASGTTSTALGTPARHKHAVARGVQGRRQHAQARRGSGARRPGAAPAQVKAPPLQHLSNHRFAYVANEVCRQAHGAAPLGLAPTNSSRLKAYVSVALPPTQGTYLSLTRLVLHSGRSSSEGKLLADYQTLILLYDRVEGRHPGPAPGSGGAAGQPSASGSAAGSRSPAPKGPVTAQQIRTAQQRAAAEARALHLPLCSPLGSGA